MKLPLATNRTVATKVIELFKLYKGEFVLVVTVQIIVAIATVVTPWVIGKSFDAVGSGTTPSVIRTYITVIIIAVIVQFIASWFADYRSRVLGQKVLDRKSVV